MKSIFLAIGLIAVTFSPVQAEEAVHQHGEANAEDKGEAKEGYCPVCGPEEEMESLSFAYKHEGTKYRFCSLDCMKAFKKNPKKYLPETKK